MKELVLLTGASTGIGREMARILARRQFDMILVSRDQVKLDTLKAELEASFNVKIDVIAKDLSNAENAVEVYNMIKGKGFQVTILINNARVGMYGDFAVLSLDKTLKMIDLNISSLVSLTNLFVNRWMLAKQVVFHVGTAFRNALNRVHGKVLLFHKNVLQARHLRLFEDLFEVNTA